MASQQEIYQTLINVGASPEEARTLSAIAMAESGGQMIPSSVDPNSHGWYQINMDAHSGVNPYDPVDASQYALKLFREQGGRPWSVFNNGDYQRYLGGGDSQVALLEEGTRGAGGGGGGSSVVAITGPGGQILGYEIHYSDGSFDILSPQEYNNLQQYGTPNPPEAPAPEKPDWGSIIDAIYMRYETEVAAGRRPRDEAVEEFNRISGMIADRINIETTQGSFDQTASVQAITRATNMEDALRSREIARADRGISIQQERGRRASDAATQILPYAIPGRTSINLPLIGDMPLNNINLDQFYDIPGLNNIPQISPKLGVPFPQPANTQMTPFDPNAYPGLPATPNVPTPDISAILFKMLTGALTG